MKANYTIHKAHSGTTEKEIAKAKRIFRQMKKEGSLYGQTATSPKIDIYFMDINYKIMAEFQACGITIGECAIN